MWWVWALLCQTWPEPSVTLRAAVQAALSDPQHHQGGHEQPQWDQQPQEEGAEDGNTTNDSQDHNSDYLHCRSYNLYENEAGSDVTLLVGDDLYRERIPAHSWVLASGNQVFRAMFQGSLADHHKKIYNIPNDPKGFQNLMKWLYQGECMIQSVEGGLITLQVAIQYLCPELAERCVQYLANHLTPNNVLRVLQEVYRYCPAHSHHNLPTVPSAPSLEELEGPPHPTTLEDSNSKSARSQQCLTKLHDLCEEADLRDPTTCCGDLFNACLEIIDRDTTTVLASEQLEDLDIAALEVVVQRGSLSINSETVIVSALYRWSTAACKRLNLPLTKQSRREVMRHLIGHVRFLLMSSEQLQHAAPILTADEYNFISGRISGRGVGVPPPTLAPHLAMMSTPRRPASPTTTKPTVNDKTKKKNNGKKKYTKKELMLDIVSCLAVIFD